MSPVQETPRPMRIYHISWARQHPMLTRAYSSTKQVLVTILVSLYLPNRLHPDLWASGFSAHQCRAAHFHRHGENGESEPHHDQQQQRPRQKAQHPLTLKEAQGGLLGDEQTECEAA